MIQFAIVGRDLLQYPMPRKAEVWAPTVALNGFTSLPGPPFPLVIRV